MMIVVWGGVATTMSNAKAAALITLGLGIVWLNDQWRAYNDDNADIQDIWNQDGVEPCEVPAERTAQQAVGAGGIQTWETNPDGSPKLPGGGKGGPQEY